MLGKLLANVIWRLVPPKRPPDFLIGTDPLDPYMRRWWIIPRNKFFNIYLHHMRHDDDDRAAHDHPWWSLSLCLRGHIKEMELLSQGEDGDYQYRVNHIYAGDWKWRGTEYAHFLKLPDGDAWTLFITGPVVRKWGFHCPKGWMFWKTYMDPNKPGGGGCGELD